MPPEAQTRLLRVLQEGEYTAVGGRTPIRVDVRIIAATHRDLPQLIRQGLFREDLFYRLNVAPIRLPPLRERSSDVPALVRHFASLATREGLPLKTLDDAAMERLRRHPWPGNVRELENLVRRLAALYSQEVIGLDIVEAELGQSSPADAPPAESAAGEGLGAAVERHINDYFAAHRGALPAAGLYDRVLREVERPLIVATLGRHPRQPDQGGASAGAEPQYAAQEDPRIGHPGRPRLKIAALPRHRAGAPRRAKAGARPPGLRPRRVLRGSVNEPGAADPRLGRRDRPVAENRDRAGGRGAWLRASRPISR